MFLVVIPCSGVFHHSTIISIGKSVHSGLLMKYKVFYFIHDKVRKFASAYETGWKLRCGMLKNLYCAQEAIQQILRASRRLAGNDMEVFGVNGLVCSLEVYGLQQLDNNKRVLLASTPIITTSSCEYFTTKCLAVIVVRSIH